MLDGINVIKHNRVSGYEKIMAKNKHNHLHVLVHYPELQTAVCGKQSRKSDAVIRA